MTFVITCSLKKNHLCVHKFSNCMIIVKNYSLVCSSSISGRFMLLIIILCLWILKLHDIFEKHLFKVTHWIVKIQALESHLLNSCILELHDVLEKSFASLLILNCENSSCSRIFILLNVFEESLTCFWFMNFHFARFFEKSLTCLSNELWFCVMLLKNHSFALDHLDSSCFWKSIQLFGS